jgi:hypothetical protein
VKEHEEDFKLFQDTVTHEDFLDNARDVIESSRVPLVISERALGRLRRANLTLSRRKLMFNYKLVFDAVHYKTDGLLEQQHATDGASRSSCTEQYTYLLLCGSILSSSFIKGVVIHLY